MSVQPPKTVWLSCGVLRRELTELHKLKKIKGELVFLNSMLHMDPPKLEEILTTTIQKYSTKVGNVHLVLVYGDCSARMLDLVSQFKVGRVNAINCAQLLVGRDRYRQLMREEAFIILPEWAMRWEQIMKQELGLSQVIARDLMGENRGSMVYLDTGLTPIPQTELDRFSNYSGLSMRTEKVRLDKLLETLLEAEKLANQAPAEGGM